MRVLAALRRRQLAAAWASNASASAWWVPNEDGALRPTFRDRYAGACSPFFATSVDETRSIRANAICNYIARRMHDI
jgi:hypothetical protein